jgi:hypothetical protein
MAGRGWIERDETGNWTPTARAVVDLREGSQETISFIRTLAAAVLAADAERDRKRSRPDG